MLPRPLAEAVAATSGRAVAGGVRVGGGDINEAFCVELDGGERAFVKTRADVPPGEYAAEAAALGWLGEPGTVAVPSVVAVADPDDAAGCGAGEIRFLALEWIDEGRLDARGAEALGRGLAAMHAAGAPAFGWRPGPDPVAPLTLGPLRLPSEPLDDWPSFYAEHRLRPLLAPATARSALPASGVALVEAVCERIADLAGPPEPAARLHGDLWSGNVLAGADGRPRLIDPAAYGGHREVDLAMVRLFGAGHADTIVAAYDEVAPLAAGHEERVALWQLFPLLVHAVLFGGGYGASVERAARRYA
jgi:fructosamine-3-kinase